MKKSHLAALALSVALPVAGFAALSVAAPAKPTLTAPKGDPMLNLAVSGNWRTPDFRARDKDRKPVEALTFWGLKPNMSVIEIGPGGGYWAEILAPYARATGGAYTATMPAADRKLPASFDKPEYGQIRYAVFTNTSMDIAAPGSADFILTARNIHNWMWSGDMDQRAFNAFYKALKPGGILAVEEHRSDPRPMVKEARDGYVSTEHVIALAQKAGFKLDARSELNANPKDKKDHPFGVWTLPPTKRTAPGGQPANPSFDRTKYDAIGESDRMTLRFVKPA